jgi:hypothetical protein
MAKEAKAKLTAEEKWLEAEFGVKVTKFDKEFQEGGKLHDKFLSTLKKFKFVYVTLNKIHPNLKKFKPDEGSKKASSAVKSMLSHHKSMETCITKGDMAGALDAFSAYMAAYGSLANEASETEIKQIDPQSELVELKKMAGFSLR